MNRQTLIADSGSTKTDWCLVGGFMPARHFHTRGINPFHQSPEEIAQVINGELLPQLSIANEAVSGVESILFYGAGCREEKQLLVECILRESFTRASEIVVDGDLMAAARAVCGEEWGIACILGTGANSCLYDGRRILLNTPPMGYVLGDEGSGAVLGKLFLNALFKERLPREIVDSFIAETGLTLASVIERVYRQPMANRFLASLSPFISSHLNCKEVEQLVVGNFTEFFRRNIAPYGRKDLSVGAVGSIAYHYRPQLEHAATLCGYRLGKVVKSPMEGLIGMFED